jgi:heavy metal sensor kinase
MRFRSIGTKLTIWYTSLLTLTILLLVGVAYGLLTYNLSREVDSALNGVAEVMARRAQGGSDTIFPPDVDALFRQFFGFSPLDRHIELFDPRGQRDPRRSLPRSRKLSLSTEALKNASQGRPTFETLPSSGKYPIRVLTKPVLQSGRVVNLVQVGTSLENIYKTRRRFLLIMAYVLPFGLLLAGGVGWVLASRALKPVDQMTQTAQRISGEHLKERLEETGSGDELDRLAKTLNDMLGRLDDAFHQMRQFSADASHELQTPLTILKGEMEVALRSPRSPDEYQQVLRSGLEEIDRINHLVEGLLLLARADAGVLRLDMQPVELNRLMQEVCAQMAVIAENHGIHLQQDLSVPATILGDQTHLRRVLLNVVDNAIKYTPAGGAVTLSLEQGNGYAIMKISDTGIGLSEAQQRRIFDRFHRATDTRARDAKGVGLGLSIARSIVKAHGGRMEVTSNPETGSTFTVHLPTESAGNFASPTPDISPT